MHRRRHPSRRPRLVGAVALLVGLAFVGACSKDATFGPGETPDPPKVTIVAPADGATDVVTAAELQFTLEGTQTAEVSLADAAGNAVTGAMRSDGSSWLPDEQLAYATQYTATVTATTRRARTYAKVGRYHRRAARMIGLSDSETCPAKTHVSAAGI